MASREDACVPAGANAMWPTEKQDHSSEHKLRAASMKREEEGVSNPENWDVTQNSSVWVGGVLFVENTQR